MNQQEKFLSFMESLKNEENEILVESVVSAFNIIMESDEAITEGIISKLGGTLAIALATLFGNSHAGMPEQLKIAKQVVKEYVQKHGVDNPRVTDAIASINKQIQRRVDDADDAEEYTQDMINFYENLRDESNTKAASSGEGTETGLEASSLQLTPEKAIASIIRSSHGDLTEDDLEVSKITVPIKEGIFSDTKQDYYFAHRKGLTAQAKKNLETQLLTKVARSVGSLPEPN